VSIGSEPDERVRQSGRYRKVVPRLERILVTEERLGSGGGTDKTRAGAAAERRAQMAPVVSSLLAGESVESGFRRVFEAYYRPLQRFFARKGHSAEDAVDLTQETFLGIYRGLKDLREEDRFEAWLYQIATTTHLKKLRSRATAKRTGSEVPHDETGMVHEAARSPASQLEGVLDSERQNVMRAAIRDLPDQMRRCLTLRLYHDLSYKEIAVLMKLKIDTVKAHLFQARAKLRIQLEKYSIDALDHTGGVHDNGTHER
jgi:RNA polymerase sigma-70 factor (ECF subfamily)